MSKQAKSSKTSLFDVITTAGGHDVVVKATKDVIRTYAVESGDMAAEACAAAEKFAKNSWAKMESVIAESNSAAAEFYTKVRDVVFPEGEPAKKEVELKEREKSRDSYNSGARKAFKPNNLTDKDAKVLGGVEAALAAGKLPIAREIAPLIGMNENQVNGAVSVLVAKGVVTTKSVRHSSGIRRAITICENYANWKELVGADKKARAAAAEERKAKAAAAVEAGGSTTTDDASE
jgi:DNA-binding transcriptional regulator YhcF (GntR family)